MGSGGSRNQIRGYQYFMAVHMGLGRGPVDELVEIRVGDRTAWPGNATPDPNSLFPDGPSTPPPILHSQAMEVRNSNLFGGTDSEGGVSGEVDVMMGEDDQVVSARIKGLMGGLVSDFRGVVSLFYRGLIATNNPYPKAWKMRVRRALKGWDGEVWYPDKAVIPLAGGKIQAMNPAHILYECTTNRLWGRGRSRDIIDDVAWRQTADILHVEGFGLCMKWSRTDSLKDFMMSVINHIGGAMYIDRGTGLLTLALVREDYDPDEIPHFTYKDGLLSVEEDSSGSPNESINEIIVSFRDPITDQVGKVRAHNLAARQSSGAAFTATVEYPGAPTSEIAYQLARRDLRAQASGLRRMKVKLDRRGWKVPPAGVFAVSAPDRGIERIILRAGKIEDGTLTSGAITITAMEDVFGLPLAETSPHIPPDWSPPDRTPLVAPQRAILEAPYREVFRRLSPAEFAQIDQSSAAVMVLASKPSSTALGFRMLTGAVGEPLVDRGMADFTPYATLAGAVTPHQTLLTIAPLSGLARIRVGEPVALGSEMVKLVSYDPVTQKIVVERGCLDTIPMAHSNGEPIWFYSPYAGTDGREYVGGEDVQAKMLTVTHGGTLMEADAPLVTRAMNMRFGRPYPPGDFRLNGVRFGDILAGTAVPSISGGGVAFTWSHRDRVLQQDAVVAHDAASIGPEVGVTYALSLYRGSNNATLHNWTGPGAGFGYTQAAWVADGSPSQVYVRLAAMRDGMESWQAYLFRFNMPN